MSLKKSVNRKSKSPCICLKIIRIIKDFLTILFALNTFSNASFVWSFFPPHLHRIQNLKSLFDFCVFVLRTDCYALTCFLRTFEWKKRKKKKQQTIFKLVEWFYAILCPLSHQTDRILNWMIIFFPLFSVGKF